MGRRYRRANEWIDNHPSAWLALAVAVPGLGYASSQMWIGGQSFESALPLGATFGVTFALTGVLARRILSD